MSDLLPTGTRIRHRRFPQLTGRIEGHERCRDGEVSFVPYRIEWDDPDNASLLLGSVFDVYGDDSTVERIEAKTNGKITQTDSRTIEVRP